VLYFFSGFVGSYCKLAASEGYHPSADAITPLRAFARMVGSSCFISWKNLDMIFVFLQASHLDQGRAGGSETNFFYGISLSYGHNDSDFLSLFPSDRLFRGWHLHLTSPRPDSLIRSVVRQLPDACLLVVCCELARRSSAEDLTRRWTHSIICLPQVHLIAHYSAAVDSPR
jgi:hypothetical protein